MKNNKIVSAIGVIGLTSLAGISYLSAQAPAPGAPGIPPQAPAGPKPSAEEMKMIPSYFFGFQQGSGLHGAGFKAEEFSTDEMVRGFLAGIKGDTMEVSQEKLQQVMTALQEVARARESAKADANLAAGNAFLEKNAKREGVTTTASGLQYEVINKGTDKKYVTPANGAADAGTKFLVNYRGTLIDGTEFDKSPEGSPVPMTLQVIPGFQEALKAMPIGSKWKLFLPAKLAYGERAASPKIGPNSALIFDLELVDIQTAPVEPKASAVTPPVEVPAPAAPKKKEEAK